MQPHDDNQRPEESDSDGGRDTQWSAIRRAFWVEAQEAIDRLNRPVHIAEAGKPVNMSAGIFGSGGVQA